MPNLYQRIAQNTLARNDKQQAIAGLRKEIRQDKKRLASRERKLKRLQDGLLPSSHDAKPEPLDFGSVIDKKEVELIKIIAPRLRDARQLCEHTLTEAANLLGVNFNDLKKIEHSADVCHVPIWLIKKAAEVYSVPSDFLLGIIGDFDACDPEVFHSRSFLSALQRQQLEEFSKTAAEQIKQNGQLKALSSSLSAAIMAQQYISEVLAGFIRLNQGFNDMPGGAKVLYQVKIAEGLTQKATAALTKYRCLPEISVEQAEIISNIFPNDITGFAE